MKHSFDLTIATKFGINIATFLDNIAYWTVKNIANERHFYDGLYWTYNSIKAFNQLFPYWSTRQLRTIIEQCVEYELLTEGNYNIAGYDHTKWYALTQKGLDLFRISPEPRAQTDLSELTNRFVRIDKPIPDSKPDSKQNIITESDDSNDSKNQKPKISTEEIVNAYNETLPQCPKIKKIDKQLSNQLKKMQKDWPTYGDSKPEFTIERFKNYLRALETHCPGFLLEYVTLNGNKRKNNLRTFTREINMAKFVNGEFNFS